MGLNTNFNDKSLAGRLGVYLRIAVADAVRVSGAVPLRILKVAADKFNQVASNKIISVVTEALNIPVAGMKHLPKIFNYAEQALETTATKIEGGYFIEGRPDIAPILKGWVDKADAFLTPDRLKQLIDSSAPLLQPA